MKRQVVGFLVGLVLFGVCGQARAGMLDVIKIDRIYLKPVLTSYSYIDIYIKEIDVKTSIKGVCFNSSKKEYKLRLKQSTVSNVFVSFLLAAYLNKKPFSVTFNDGGSPVCQIVEMTFK